MTITQPRRAVAKGFARVLPERCVTNDHLAQLMETSDEWITQRTGIKTRYWVDPPTTTSDLATQSARQSMAKVGGAPDAIIAATLSPDHYFPGIGVQLQNKLSLGTVPAFDIRAQCAGFLYSLQMARSFIQSQAYQRILVVGAEVHSTGLDLSTRGRDLAVLFGDGAGSCVVEPSTDNDLGGLEILDVVLHAEGAHAQELWCEHPGSSHFPVWLTPELVSEGETFPSMNGRVVFEHAVRRMSEVSKEILARCRLSSSDVTLFVPHQANLRINMMVARELELRPDQVFNTIERYGNTTAATIPIGLSDAFAAGRIPPGAIVLSAAFGSGFVWGAAVFRALGQ